METPIFEIIEKAAENQKKGIAFVMATVVEGVEKTPGRSGFKLLYYQDGSIDGTVGGGKLERLVLDKCSEIFQTPKSALLEFALTETSEGIGMACGGTAKVFLEYFPPTKKAYIFGAGHLCRSVVPLLTSIGFYCVVIDNREDFANKERIPLAKEVLAVDYLKFLEKFEPAETDAILIFTHGHIHDFDILDALCRNNVKAKYIGMIGSKTKVKQAIDKIEKSKYAGDLISKVFAPIGLNIGKTTTQEIAIAISAEILAVYNDVKKIEHYKNEK
ncbi:MAG: XdhC/CoxI family protein [Candidatus Cloacimonetes bacterium]|nr:XdhC/CoxI family protein [Candidatus Cloacimonadota bacterium]MCF7814480.1 XdhC/CoxI family protein [Candidatus Cloacimonadota bacterium]MCF7867872.1 XdhC/CoxI family protein [Candidatus Cloacimonadota bacterium]MCF7883691.1 XdhC/CoxI family protein [Candidatus Cloacimonadota bacterium]